MNKRIKTLSLFSGGGGLDLGFAAIGFDIVGSVDIDPYSCKTLNINCGKKSFFKHHAILNKDLKQISSDEILEKSNLNAHDIDFVIGGPPCQAFSVFGQRKGLGDPRGNLIWEFLRIIKEIKPKGFVFENVIGLKSIHNGELYQDLLKELSIDGEYVVSDHNYNLEKYGVPQYRDRIFFIGYRGGERIPPMVQTHGPVGFFAESNDLLPFVTVKKVLAGMPEPGPDSNLPNHIGRVHSNRIIERYQNLKFGERDSKTRINKLHPDKPSFTIIVGSDAGGGKGHIHPFSPREVTPRESARIQTFPDWWEFYGTGRHVIRQVGNAVPPLFAAQLAQHIAKYIFKKKPKHSYKDLIILLGLDYLHD